MSRICETCGAHKGFLPSEEWGPYKWLWSRTAGRPWTHVFRDNPFKFLGTIAASGALVSFWNGRRYAPVVVSGLVGFLAGHVFW